MHIVVLDPLELLICGLETWIFGRPFVKRFALCYRTVVLSYNCGQTVGWIKVPLGKEVGLGPGHTVLDGDPSPHSSPSPLFGSCLLWPNGRLSQQLLSSCASSTAAYLLKRVH